MAVLLVCVPASRLIAGLVERKRNTFTVAGAAFVGNPDSAAGWSWRCDRWSRRCSTTTCRCCRFSPRRPSLTSWANRSGGWPASASDAATACRCVTRTRHRAPLPQAQSGDSRHNQESGLRFGAGRRAADSGAGDHVGGIRRVWHCGSRAVSGAAVSTGRRWFRSLPVGDGAPAPSGCAPTIAAPRAFPLIR